MRWLCVLVCFLIGFPGYAPCVNAADRLNVLLITADDMNADSVGWMGNPLRLTPNLDAFARTAHRLVNNHSTCPICQPGRQAMLTGRVPHRSGGLGFDPIDANVPTLVEVLREAGYFTAAIEKLPHMAPAEKFPWDAAMGGQVGRNPAAFRLAIRETLAQAQASHKPFFINANITDPHRPFFGAAGKKQGRGEGSQQGVEPLEPNQVTVPGFLENLPEVRAEVAQYYSSVRRLDVTFGAILDELKAAGRLADTIVVFWSDHGMSFPFSKATVYRNGTWSPVLIRYPGLNEPRELQEFTSSIDLMPTLLELLHVAAPAGLDGRTWMPLFQGAAQPDRDFVITHVNTVSSGKAFPQRCVRTRNYSFMFHGWTDGSEKFRVEAMSGKSFAAMQAEPKLRSRVAQLLVGEPLMFFDLAADPDERTNRLHASQYAPVIDDLARKLLAHMERTNDPQTEAFRAAWKQHQNLPRAQE